MTLEMTCYSFVAGLWFMIFGAGVDIRWWLLVLVYCCQIYDGVIWYLLGQVCHRPCRSRLVYGNYYWNYSILSRNEFHVFDIVVYTEHKAHRLDQSTPTIVVISETRELYSSSCYRIVRVYRIQIPVVNTHLFSVYITLFILLRLLCVIIIF